MARIGRMSSDGAIRDEWGAVVDTDRYCGYSSMQALFGGANVALAVEVEAPRTTPTTLLILAVLDVAHSGVTQSLCTVIIFVTPRN